MIIAGFVKNSLIDFPGYISCVIFVPGCNYDCYFCHNRQLLDGTHDILDQHEIWNYLIKRVGLLDGVVITGGEPTLQPDLISYIRKIKTLGYLVKLDSNGSSPEVISQLLDEGLCDYYAIDYKAPAAMYQEICGPQADPKSVQETINLLLDRHADFEVRTTRIPELTDADLVTMKNELPDNLPKYNINRYRKN